MKYLDEAQMKFYFIKHHNASLPCSLSLYIYVTQD
jgi:hypothetical protein